MIFFVVTAPIRSPTALRTPQFVLTEDAYGAGLENWEAIVRSANTISSKEWLQAYEQANHVEAINPKEALTKWHKWQQEQLMKSMATKK